MCTFSAVLTGEDFVLFASLNWKIHFYFPPGKDTWRALIYEQRQITGELIKTYKIVNYIEYTSSTSYCCLLRHKEGATIELKKKIIKFNWNWIEIVKLLPVGRED